MVTSQQILDALRQIGLNLYERKLWTALLSTGNSSAGELSSLAKVPHSRTYDVLESLAEKGFVLIQNTKPLKYVAIEPKESLERAKKKIKKDADISIDRISELQSSSILKELNDIYRKGIKLIEPGEFTGSLRGTDAMHNQLENVFKSAKNKISIITTEKGLNELHANHADLLKKISNKGVKVRIAAPHTKETSSLISQLKPIAEIKKLAKNAGRFILIDDCHVVLALTDDKDTHPSQNLAFWTQNEHVVGDVLGPMFEIFWQKLPSA